MHSLNLGYFRNCISFIAEQLKAEKTDQQIATALNERGFLTTRGSNWTAGNVAGTLTVLRKDGATGSWATALAALRERGEVTENQIATVRRYRPRFIPTPPTKKADKPAVASPDAKVSYMPTVTYARKEDLKKIITEFGSKNPPFTFGQVMDEILSRNLMRPPTNVLVRLMRECGYHRRHFKLGGKEKHVYASPSISTEDIRAKLGVNSSAKAKPVVQYKAQREVKRQRGYLVYLNAASVVGVEDFESEAEQRAAYGNACIQLIEQGGVGAFDGNKFNNVQKFLR